ncbi:MAG TPA: hypothetical protein VFJ58_19560 [Armatimonadota bacterium]|nr:hypothetical protein [Armatimonadota bacterium]
MRDGAYVDRKKEGLWVSYHANGTKMSEGHFRNGQKHGAWTLYWPNGNKKREGTFVNGKYTGLYTEYYENGNRHHQGYYNTCQGNSADGTKDGSWHYFEPDGETIAKRITYHRGSRAKPDEVPPFKDEGGKVKYEG